MKSIQFSNRRQLVSLFSLIQFNANDRQCYRKYRKKNLFLFYCSGVNTHIWRRPDILICGYYSFNNISNDRYVYKVVLGLVVL